LGRVELEIPPRSPYVGVVRLVIAALARNAGLDEEAVDDLKIAVSEACANAVLSSEEAGSDEPVSVTWDEGGEDLVIEISDHGTPYHGGGGDPLDSQGLSSRLAMSMALLQSLVPRCEFSDSEAGGTLARLVIDR
jgi:anti-sigma regulatory factor (Ser/Thr protein kinase)